MKSLHPIKSWSLYLLCSALFLTPAHLLSSEDRKDQQERIALLSSLDPTSIPKHLAFYYLYQEFAEGKEALKRAWSLLSKHSLQPFSSIELPQLSIAPLISALVKEGTPSKEPLSLLQIYSIEKLAEGLCNRHLPGSFVWSQEEVLALEPCHIDLARALLILQFGENRKEIVRYEALLDLMALQILARITPESSAEEKIGSINRFIFEEMEFRFPPHSIHIKEIDFYTFLPSVLDGREGVCLGVSMLYLSLAQRIGLPLEIITPPGHIYLRHREGTQIINIETTARGINPPSESYLGIDTRRLQQRTLKDVIGLSLVNQASVAWGKKDYTSTVSLYEKAVPYLGKDPMLSLFLGLNYLFVGKKSQGVSLLKPLVGFTHDHAVSKETIPEDFLLKRVDVQGLKAIFLPVDETRESILAKQKELEAILKRYPKFRAGLLQLATTWLQLGRTKEALSVLKKYHKLDPSSSVVEYYLAALYLERFNYPKALHHLRKVENLTKGRDYSPKGLRSLRAAIRQVYAE